MRKSPQEVYEAYKEAFQQMPARAQELLYQPPDNWEAVTERDRAIFAKMALKTNSIYAEFVVENK